MKMKVLFSALCLLVSISVCAEVLAPDSMPEFPGGMSAMMTYLRDNVKYPADHERREGDGCACGQVQRHGKPG